MKTTAMCSLIALFTAVLIAGCGGDKDSSGNNGGGDAAKKAAVPRSVQDFANQLKGCLDESPSNRNYEGPIAAKQAGDLQSTAVLAAEGPVANADLFVFSSKADARAAANELAEYRQGGGQVQVKGLVLIAHKKPLGNLGCLEEARKAAGPELPDPPPAAAKLTPADRKVVLRAATVPEYCADKDAGIDSPAFADDTAARQAVAAFAPLLERSPDSEIKLQDNYTLSTPREVARTVAAVADKCLGAEAAAQLKAVQPE